jgi:hypothetical protein
MKRSWKKANFLYKILWKKLKMKKNTQATKTRLVAAVITTNAMEDATEL